MPRPDPYDADAYFEHLCGLGPAQLESHLRATVATHTRLERAAHTRLERDMPEAKLEAKLAAMRRRHAATVALIKQARLDRLTVDLHRARDTAHTIINEMRRWKDL